MDNTALLSSHRGCSKDGCPKKSFFLGLYDHGKRFSGHPSCIDDVPIKLTQFCIFLNHLDRGGNSRSNVIEHYSKSPLKSLHYLCSISPHLSQMQGPVEIHIDSEANLSQWVSMADEILGLMVAARTPFRYKVSKLAINNFHMRQSQHLRWLLSMIDKKVGSMEFLPFLKLGSCDLNFSEVFQNSLKPIFHQTFFGRVFGR